MWRAACSVNRAPASPVTLGGTGSGGSLVVNVGGDRAGTWHDFEADESGGVLDLVEREVGCDRPGALDWLRREGIHPGREQERIQKRRTPAAPTPDRRRDEADDPKMAYVRRIWFAAGQTGIEAAACYLVERRWCWPPRHPLPDVVRWLTKPAAEQARRRLPQDADGALIFAFTNLAGHLAGVQLEALDETGRRVTAWPGRDGCPRDAKRLTHGRTTGAWFRLTPPGKAETLVLVEGPLDALAAWWLHPGATVWACGGSLRLMPADVPDNVERVILEADADATDKADALGRKLKGNGKVVKVYERQAGDVATQLRNRLREAFDERAAIREHDSMSRAEIATLARADAWRPYLERRK